jgi:hypothetical protein
MRRRSISTLVILAALCFGPAGASQANTIRCGGNSVSYAEVLPRQQGRPRKGPIQALPDTLCADLIEVRRPQVESLQVTIDPRAAPDPRAAQSPRPGHPPY